jgi:hypothetical protein
LASCCPTSFSALVNGSFKQKLNLLAIDVETQKIGYKNLPKAVVFLASTDGAQFAN